MTVQTLKIVGHALIALAVIDAFIVFTALTAVAYGEPVQHIPFWDAQMRLIINLIT